MQPENSAAWILEPKSELQVRPAAYYSPDQGEIVIKVCDGVVADAAGYKSDC